MNISEHPFSSEHAHIFAHLNLIITVKYCLPRWYVFLKLFQVILDSLMLILKL